MPSAGLLPRGGQRSTLDADSLRRLYEVTPPSGDYQTPRPVAFALSSIAGMNYSPRQKTQDSISSQRVSAQELRTHA